MGRDPSHGLATSCSSRSAQPRHLQAGPHPCSHLSAAVPLPKPPTKCPLRLQDLLPEETSASLVVQSVPLFCFCQGSHLSRVKPHQSQHISISSVSPGALQPGWLLTSLTPATRQLFPAPQYKETAAMVVTLSHGVCFADTFY